MPIKKSSGTVRIGSGCLRVERGGSGAKTPPLAARPRDPRQRGQEPKSLNGKQQCTWFLSRLTPDSESVTLKRDFGVRVWPKQIQSCDRRQGPKSLHGEPCTRLDF